MGDLTLNYNEIEFYSFPFTENDVSFLQTARGLPNSSCEIVVYAKFSPNRYTSKLNYNNAKMMHNFLKNVNPKLNIYNDIGRDITYIILYSNIFNLKDELREKEDIFIPLILFKDFYVPNTSIVSLDTPISSDIIRNI